MNNDHTFKLMRKCVILLLLFATQETFSQTKIFNSYPLEELIKRIFDSSNGLIVFFVNILHNSHSTNFS